MPVATTRNLIELVKNFHHQLADHCNRVARFSDDERVKLLLEYVSRHEKYLADALQAYAGQAEQKMLNTWFRDVPLPILPTLDNDALKATSTVDEVIAWAVRMDNAIISLYRTLAAVTDTPAMQNVMENLLAMEQREQLKMVRSALRINDI